jgi:Flp pilus assembly protein TadG
MTHTKGPHERGAIAVFMMLILTVVMGFAAMAFDLSYVRLARFEMKNATDAAAHAAMHVLYSTKSTAQARTAAETVASKNTVLGYAVTLADADVTFGTWDYNSSSFTASATIANAVQVNGHKAEPTAPDGTVLTTFGRTIGTASANIAQASYGAYRTRATMFEMDITGSFLQQSCALDQAIAADLAFLDDMNSAGIYNDKIGLDVFTGDARNFTPLQTLGPNYLTIRNLWKGDALPANQPRTSGIGVCTKPAYATGTYAPCPGAGLPPWPNELNLAPGVANINCALGDFHYAPTVPGVYGGTNIGAGINSGIATLNSANNYDIRAIVVFTDGGPMCCENPDGGPLCLKNGAGVIPNPCCADGTDPACADNGTGACNCAVAVANYGVAEATAAAASNIDVYTLAFAQSPLTAESTRWFNYAGSLVRGRGFALNTIDPTTLTAQLLKISNSLQIALVQ